MKFCHLQKLNGWNWRTSSQVKLANLRRPKIICFFSYEDFRPKTNLVILLDMGHAKGRMHTGGKGKERKGNIKLESV
jgi:hypothetical protein